MSTSYALIFLGAAVVLLILVAALSSLTSKGYVFASGRIQGVVGLMGSGKSLFVMARVILPAAAALSKNKLVCSHTKRPVKRIITNFTVDLPFEGVEVIVLDGNRVWHHLAELASEHGGQLDAIIVIDEAHLYVPAAKIKLGQVAAYICSMARKLNAELWWITQNQMKVHKRLRDDTQLIWRVKRSASLAVLLFGPSKWFQAQAFEPEVMHSLNASPVDQRRYRLTKQVADAYNSLELIVPDADVDVSIEPKTPPVAVPTEPVVADDDDEGGEVTRIALVS